MENNKIKVADVFKEKVAEIQDAAKDTLDAVIDNAGELANQAIENTEEIAEQLKEKAVEAKDEFDRYRYCPIMYEELNSDDFEYPRIIKISEKNNLANKAVCKDAVAFRKKPGYLELIKKDIPKDKVTLLPNDSGIIFCKDAYAFNTFIVLDDYFDRVKKQRVDELVEVAHKLGAKYVKIVYKEEKKSFVDAGAKKGKKQNVGNNINVADGQNINANVSSKEYVELEVAAEVEWEGSSEPQKPNLVYFKNDAGIETLIKMIMEGNNKPKKYSKMIRYSRTNDISLDAAIEIDGILSSLSLKSNASVKSEVEKENRLFLDILIEF